MLWVRATMCARARCSSAARAVAAATAWFRGLTLQPNLDVVIEPRPNQVATFQKHELFTYANGYLQIGIKSSFFLAHTLDILINLIVTHVETLRHQIQVLQSIHKIFRCCFRRREN